MPCARKVYATRKPEKLEDENPAALVKRLNLSRHEAVACGDPGKGSETDAGAGLDEEARATGGASDR